MQFVKVFSTYNGGETLANQVNRTLADNPDCVVKQVLPCPIEKIGGVDTYAMVVFETKEDN